VIVSVTVLGSSDGTAPSVIGKRIADYLEGGRAMVAVDAALGEAPASSSGAAAYYADSAELRPGQWALGRSGNVDVRELATILSGIDPISGEPLIAATGSAGRARKQRGEPLAAVDLDQSWYSVREAAAVLGVSARYVRKFVRDLVLRDGDDESGISVDRQGRWQLSREALLRIDGERTPPTVVAGYDLTFSPAKSVSVLWAGGDEITRTAVLDALDESVAAGLRYLERHALAVRVRGQSELAAGLIAADYLHTTSRALEPQLHHHVVVANVGVGSDGIARALDSRTIFRHAKTASFLAAAELRYQLTTRLGVSWGAVQNGIAEIEGIPAAAIKEMSSRSRDVEAAVAALGVTSARARQVAAWSTRAAKDRAVDPEALFAAWDERLAAAGYDQERREAVIGRVEGPESFSSEKRERLFAELLRIDGLTDHEAVFDRRLVVQRLADLVGDRLGADAIDVLADELLERPELVKLATMPIASVIQRDDGQADPAPREQLYSTEAMLTLEGRVLAAYERGRRVDVGAVAPEVVAEVLADERFVKLSGEQRAFVASLTGSGMRIQAGVGAAGSGKTTALEAAVAVWAAAGCMVLGAAVGGTQAVILSEETGVEARTVASVIARYLDHGDVSIVDDRTVILVDEASLISTRDFAALAKIAEERGALLRVVGDAAQHSSVNAGGVFRHLTENHASEVPSLTHLYRQRGSEMEQVRLANAEYREGMITKALERLAADGRIAEASSAAEAYDLLACGWYAERQRRITEPERRRSAMTAEHHAERRELNDRARELLRADGTLFGPELRVGELCFQAGEEVVARVPDRALRAAGAARDAYVRNGSFGRVAEVRANSLVVEFERWGRIEVPHSYLCEQLTSGAIGGLQHAYALTTHAAQGETFAVATPLLTDASSREGVYVGVTRGQFELSAVMIRERDVRGPLTDDDLPVLRDETATLVALERRLLTDEPDHLASELHRLDRVVGRDDAPVKNGALAAASSNPSTWSDAALLESAQRVDRLFRTANADLARLEADRARRQLSAAASGEFKGSNAARSASHRIDVVADQVETLALQRIELAAELERRALHPEKQTQLAGDSSLPSGQDLLSATAVGVAMAEPTIAR
jgi:conjugative relaxase-like TrwC/TraI family protein